jgi:hypothetical protein
MVSSNAPANSSTKGLLRLADCATSCSADSVQIIADRLMDQLIDETPRDDVALVVKGIH